MRKQNHPDPELDRLEVEAVANELRSMFELRACRYEPFPFDVQLPRIEPGRIVLPPIEPGIAPWRLDAGVELPVRSNDLPIGRFVLVGAAPTSGVRFSAALRAEAINLADRVAAAIVPSILVDT